MIVLLYSCKFRAFGITLGTVSGNVDISTPIRAVATKLAMPLLTRAAGPALAATIAQAIGAEALPKFERQVWVDDRGVYVAVEGR